MSEKPSDWQPWDGLLEAVALGLVLFSLAWLAARYGTLPEKVPTHFGFDGTPDQWGSKATLWLLPGVALFLYLLLTVVSRFPQTFNFPVPVTPENREPLIALAQQLLRWLKVETIALFTWIQGQTLQVAGGRAEGLGSLFIYVTLGVIFGTIALYVGRMFAARGG